MGLWDALRGRNHVRTANLDALFALPTAAITLQTALGFDPTGWGSVCYRAAEGSASSAADSEATSLIEADQGPQVEHVVDGFGFTWLVVHTDPPDVSGLVTDLHAVNSTLEVQGFATGLLCSLVGFADGSGRRLGLVYLYRSGSFYPFCPTGASTRDTLLERQVRDLVGTDLPIEAEPSRWMPVWGAPRL
ncbi:MAG: hypothetical protein M3Z50_11900 [Actinomycetota bacterium]|nr:hypothetical protein [Actinomycetota bacterium]